MTTTASHPTGSRASARVGVAMAGASMTCVQLGLAVSVDLVDTLGPEGVAWLRLAWAGIVCLLLGRAWRLRLDRDTWVAAVGLGLATGAVTLLFMGAVARIPLGTASALEFLGPLGVAVVRGRGFNPVWPGLAAVGVLMLTRPWGGLDDPVGVGLALAAALAWAAYIVTTQAVGDRLEGLSGLGISMPVAALLATLVLVTTRGTHAFEGLTPGVLLAGLGVALLLPVVPFSLEMLALRRLNAAAFGTLMSLEPAIALVVGLLLLGQVPAWLSVAGIGFVVAAGIGAERQGARAA